MNATTPTAKPVEGPKKKLNIKLFAIGNTGLNVMEHVVAGDTSGLGLAAVNTDAESLAACPASETLHLETRPLRGLGTGGDPERGRELAEEYLPKLKALCEGVDVAFIVAGLGGGAGTGIAPVLARAARESGALVLAFVTTPFACECTPRQRLAQHGLAALRDTADGVICLPNEKIIKLTDEGTRVVETFKLSDELLADAVRGIWNLLTRPGLIEIHFEDLCALIRDCHSESAFAVAEAMGATRSRDVLDKLLAHPMLDGGEALEECDAALVSLMGGPDLTMAELNRVMEQIREKCGHGQVIMGAAIDEAFRDRLAVTLIAARKSPERSESGIRGTTDGEELAEQLLQDTPKPGSRFVPPPPPMSLDTLEQLMGRPGTASAARARKRVTKMLQTQLPLEIVSKGRFDKSEPTIYNGEDLDVPTYIRRGVALN